VTARTARWLALASVAAFGALHLAMLADFGRGHADEHFYTDAAIRMLEEGDLLTAHAADGTPRFHKPLLTYWVLVASFRLLGIGLVASRLPFLLAAVLLAWLTWRVALVWSGDPATALLAVVILLAEPETTQLATRATPDVLLCLFLTACLLGLSRIAIETPPSAAAACWAWIGGGLAVATKGLPGLLALLYGGAILAMTRRLRALLRPGAVTLGAAVAQRASCPRGWCMAARR
jgi:4-amino-4-deoxy-L-arabinose transferase-like glycosyltransferase